MRHKNCLLGLITITAAFGFVSSPARAQNAAVVDQSSGQYTVQQGVGNSSVNASDQNGIVLQKQVPFSSGINAATMNQNSNQGALQLGRGNSSVNASKQDGTISQGHSYRYSPYGSGINASELTQHSGQAVGQLGVGNGSINLSNQGSTVQQH